MYPDQDKNVDFVVKHYKEGAFDAEEAIRRFHDSRPHVISRRWWAAAAAVFAAFVLFAGGYTVYNITQQESSATDHPVEQMETSTAAGHTFVFDNTPLNEVLKQMSDYYGCTLTTSDPDKRLSASFPDDDLEVIVAAIEEALGVEITIEK